VEAMTAARSEGAAGPGAPPRPELAGSAGELALA
jgi:hypothetical protein